MLCSNPALDLISPNGCLGQKDEAEDFLPCGPVGSAQTMPRETVGPPQSAHHHLKFGLDANISSWTSAVFRDGRWTQRVEGPEVLYRKPWLCSWLHSP